MKLVSTRDIEKKGSSYTDVLLAGLAPDGGLYVPSEYPQFSVEELKSLQDAPYIQVALATKHKLIGEAIPKTDLEGLIAAAYKKGSDGFDVEGDQITPLRPMREGLYLENLSLGPTAAFKDMALQQLAEEMEYELNRRDTTLRILGATSGDTGSAAEAGIKGLSRLTLFMLSPETGMSDFQKAQMGSLSGDNIFNISVRGRFDDCQDMVKEVKGEPEFSDLGAVNSINWGRISSQVPYYVSGYLQAAKNIGDPVDFVVPSGNFGNVLSGYVARKMGVPIRKLIIATNENNVLHKLFTTGVYELTPATVTSSPSMDISKASNYERLVFSLLGNDGEKTAAYMQEFATSGSVDLKEYGLGADVFAKNDFFSGESSHAKRLQAIKETYDEAGTVIDPHTSDGVAVAKEYFDPSEKVPMICLETALPVKFESTIKEALGFVPDRPTRFEGLEASIPDDAFTVIDPDVESLKEFIRANS